MNTVRPNSSPPGPSSSPFPARMASSRPTKWSNTVRAPVLFICRSCCGINITQQTEVGTHYNADEIADLGGWPAAWARPAYGTGRALSRGSVARLRPSLGVPGVDALSFRGDEEWRARRRSRGFFRSLESDRFRLSPQTRRTPVVFGSALHRGARGLSARRSLAAQRTAREIPRRKASAPAGAPDPRRHLAPPRASKATRSSSNFPNSLSPAWARPASVSIAGETSPCCVSSPPSIPKEADGGRSRCGCRTLDEGRELNACRSGDRGGKRRDAAQRTSKTSLPWRWRDLLTTRFGGVGKLVADDRGRPQRRVRAA